MNAVKKFWYRFRQGAMYVGAAFLPWREPELLQGEGCFSNAAEFLVRHGAHHPLVVCDKSALERHALDAFFANAQNVLKYTVYDGVLPNPTVRQAEEGFALYLYEDCDSILAFGGGSVIDCAKAIGARAARPEKTLKQMKGMFKIRKKIPPLFAVPTTAGTGSECTVAAVISDDATHDKYVINDLSLIPGYAVLDPTLTADMPPMLTAATGMDALTHAVEAYLGRSNTEKTKQQAEDAVVLIFRNLRAAVKNGRNLQTRADMQEAAYLAGLAFTRAYVGYVHALAHAVGGRYDIPHGFANAVLLPHVLKKYGECAHKKLSRLAKLTGAANPEDSDGFAASKFISAIEGLNAEFGIPSNFEGKIKLEDVAYMAERADKEANPLYPVPQLWEQRDFAEVLQKVM